MSCMSSTLKDERAGIGANDNANVTTGTSRTGIYGARRKGQGVRIQGMK